jgi:hypothetical protein
MRGRGRQRSNRLTTVRRFDSLTQLDTDGAGRYNRRSAIDSA